MSLKTKPAVVDQRLTVFKAARQVAEDANLIRARLELSSPFLRPEDFHQIEREGIKIMQQRKRGYMYYEIGHVFMVEHLAYTVGKRAKLNEGEELLLRQMMGRLNYNPPSEEFSRRAIASQKIHDMGERGRQIHHAYRAELELADKLIAECYRFGAIKPDTWRAALNGVAFGPDSDFEKYGKFLDLVASHRHLSFYR